MRRCSGGKPRRRVRRCLSLNDPSMHMYRELCTHAASLKAALQPNHLLSPRVPQFLGHHATCILVPHALLVHGKTTVAVLHA